jgi:hypothetical protein
MSDTQPSPPPALVKPTVTWLAAQRAKQDAYAAARRRQAQAWAGAEANEAEQDAGEAASAGH